MIVDPLPANAVPVVLMTSFARSGETLLQRCLNAHPQIDVVYQIVADDLANDARLAWMLMRSPEAYITRDHKRLRHRTLKPSCVLLLKHGIWVHRYPNTDFLLIRNPFSIVQSLRRHSVDNGEDEPVRRKRLVRWATGIDETLIDLCQSGDETEALTRLYVAKVMAPESRRLGVFHYETFVREPEAELRRLIGLLDLPWTDSVLHSERAYAEGDIGHGGIKLWRPVDRAATVYDGGLEPWEFDMIASIARDVLERYGYDVSNRGVVLSAP